MKKYIIIIVAFILLAATALWGNLTFAYCAFKIKGIELVKIGYFVDEYLAANINIHKEGKDYNVTICNIKSSKFISNGSFNILQINGYGVSTIGCETAKHKKVFDLATKKYVGSMFSSLRIYFNKNSAVNDFFTVKINNVSDFIDNIDIVETKLMSLSMNDYTYFMNEQGDEIYIKRIKSDNEHIVLNRSDKKNKSLLIFKNPDCSCKD